MGIVACVGNKGIINVEFYLGYKHHRVPPVCQILCVCAAVITSWEDPLCWVANHFLNGNCPKSSLQSISIAGKGIWKKLLNTNRFTFGSWWSFDPRSSRNSVQAPSSRMSSEPRVPWGTHFSLRLRCFTFFSFKSWIPRSARESLGRYRNKAALHLGKAVLVPILPKQKTKLEFFSFNEHKLFFFRHFL